MQLLANGLLVIAFFTAATFLFAYLSDAALFALAFFAEHAGLDPVASSLAAHAFCCLDFGSRLLPFQGSAAAAYHPVEAYNLL